jgi:hypothetical protein
MNKDEPMYGKKQLKFCLVWFILIKTTKLKLCKILKKNWNQFKPAGFGSVQLFYIRN